jgi:histidine triad (HIT) family protein
MSCVFCAVVAGDAPAIRIYEDDDYLAILDIRPFSRGHTLVIPKRHTVDLTDTPPETVAAMAKIGQRIARAARVSGLNTDGNNVVINDGKSAFQSVDHIHLHVLPRRSGDKLSFAKNMLLRRDPDREESGRLLREALAQLDSAAQD